MSREQRQEEREQQVLACIKRSLEEHGYPPTVREIGKAAGLRSTSSVHGYLRRMEQKGLLRRRNFSARGLELADGRRAQSVAVPLLGRVAAGAPLLSEQNIDALLELPAAWLANGEHFVLRVQGDSMIERGIHPGDLLLVRRQETAQDGDVVVALLDGETTVKTLRLLPQTHLEPANARYKPIFDDQLRILGKVVRLVREMR